MDTKTFISPLPKLVHFFHKSRDAWKAKCQKAKHKCKMLSNQNRAVEKSRDHWKEKARQYERELRELKKQSCPDKNSDSACSAARR